MFAAGCRRMIAISTARACMGMCMQVYAAWSARTPRLDGR
jgi:hypothetical protein